jgi:hypothetical protein
MLVCSASRTASQWYVHMLVVLDVDVAVLLSKVRHMICWQELAAAQPHDQVVPMAVCVCVFSVLDRFPMIARCSFIMLPMQAIVSTPSAPHPL